ncbi:uncharacterized protein ARMOST_11897 [Armillaria ostoyae]|uniref:ATP-dependent DNA helicase n=1 Tax=Armillaria ostoyae TaxID=47428 RepID=A0A284RIF6_ARMOS|nr:uncharacterized protein ARMOST_11897 [Armillaria ostoyae]
MSSLVALNKEQNQVVRMVLQGLNVFFTGAAGTGKSMLLKVIMCELRSKYPEPEGVAVTASTGMAASNIGGHTLYSWGGILPAKEDVESIVKSIHHNSSVLSCWKNVQVLIIDEVSMVDGALFNRLHAIASKLRGKPGEPFGGIQLVVTGDFFQLPPVTKGGKEPFFAFESQAWKMSFHHSVNLAEVFQQNDTCTYNELYVLFVDLQLRKGFIQALNSLRVGKPSPDAIQLFTSLSRPIMRPVTPPRTSNTHKIAIEPGTIKKNIFPTELYPHRFAAAEANLR